MRISSSLPQRKNLSAFDPFLRLTIQNGLYKPDRTGASRLPSSDDSATVVRQARPGEAAHLWSSRGGRRVGVRLVELAPPADTTLLLYETRFLGTAGCIRRSADGLETQVVGTHYQGQHQSP